MMLKSKLLCFVRFNGFKRNLSGNVIKSPFNDIVIPNTTLVEHVWRNIDKWDDKIATVCGVTGRSYTYNQLRKLSRNLAVSLRRKFQLNDGDCIALATPNIPEYPGAVLGSAEAGCSVTTLNHVYTSYEIAKQLNLSDAKLIITISSLYETVKQSLQTNGKYIPIIVIKTNKDEALPNGAINFNELIDIESYDTSILKCVKRTSNDVVLLPYSSGTTGLPKGVELTNRNITSNIIQMDDVEIRHFYETTANHQDTIIAVLPFFHIYGGVLIMLDKLANGCKLVTLPKFEMNSFLNNLIDHRVSLVYAAPPMVLALTNHSIVRTKHFEHMRLLMSAAAPIPQVDVFRFLDKAQKDIQFIQGYGLTETSPLVTIMRNNEVNYESVGYALPNTELKIVNEKGDILPPGEVGELLIKGPQKMKGYRKNDKATAEVMTDDGFFRSGDLASHDHSGSIKIADRLKELIKVKGFQVPPAELESVIREHPDVLDAVVVGIKDPRYGEAPKGFVVTKLEKNQSSADDIMKFVADRVAPYKKLHSLAFIDTIPKSLSGKILRREVRRMVETGEL